MSDYSLDFVFLHQPDESVADDFLFPMSSGISYNSSPESDGEFCEPETPRNMSRQPSEEPSHMSRYNSDPNLANLEQENDNDNQASNANNSRRLPPQTPEKTDTNGTINNGKSQHQQQQSSTQGAPPSDSKYGF